MSPHREKQLLDFLHGLYAPRGGHQLIEFILQHIPGIIACHNRGIARYDPARRAAGEMAPVSFWQMKPEARHPVHIVSQTFTRSQWDEHPMYREMFRAEGLVDCLTLEFGDADRRFMFCLHRDRRGFTSKELEIIRLLAPHLEQAFANARLFETALPALPSNSPTDHTRVHPLGPVGDSCSDEIFRQSRARWHSLLGHEPVLDGLRAWIDHCLDHLACGALDSAVTPFTLQGSTTAIRFSLMRHWGGDGHLLIEEATATWHLTPREQEVLQWVRAGKSDRDIGTILNLSHHTVKEHLRRIYQKTGTRTRTAAARLVPHPGDSTSTSGASAAHPNKWLAYHVEKRQFITP